MSTRRNLSMLAAAVIAIPVTFSLPARADAQQFFTQKQIVHKLRRHRPQGQFKQHHQQQVFIGQQPKRKLRRAPQPDGQFQQFRAPQPEEPIAKFRAPEPGGKVVLRRAPESNGGKVVFRRAPEAQDGPRFDEVQEFRAPPSENDRPRRKPVRPVEVASASERGLDVRPADEVATDPADSGRIDLEILFDYDSARIDPGSVKQLIELGEALNDPELGGSRIVIAGHTDASGSNSYNADLSLRRARAVTAFLIDYAGIDPRRLVTEGYGEEYLKFPDAPESGQNRRVEIINLGEAG